MIAIKIIHPTTKSLTTVNIIFFHRTKFNFDDGPPFERTRAYSYRTKQACTLYVLFFFLRYLFSTFSHGRDCLCVIRFFRGLFLFVRNYLRSHAVRIKTKPATVAIGRLNALPVVPPVSLYIVTFAVSPPSPHVYSTVWCRCGRGWSRSWEKRQARGLRFCT